MSLINHAIPNLFNGVSQQAASIRQPSQGELQENAFSSVVFGVHKRHPTSHVAKLISGTISGAYVHLINRDATERYAVIIQNGSIQVWDINGNAKTLTAPNGYSYLSSGTPSSDFSVVTIADYTIIVNKTITTAMKSTTSATNAVNVAYFFVAAAPAQHTLTATVDGISGTASLGTSGGTQGGLAAALASSLSTALGAGYTVTRPREEIIKVVKNSGAALTASCSDTYGDSALRCLNQGVRLYDDLPAKFDPNFIVTINGDLGNSKYYVKFDTTNNGWVETTAPGIAYQIDPATMPYKLVRNADGTFTFSQITWPDRVVGDLNSAPTPSFIGRKLNDVFFFRNRLGFLASENVIFSRAGEFFSFFPETAVQVLDSDPIDTAVSHTKVSILNSAIPFNKNLLLFSDQTQFVLAAQDTLTPKTVVLHPTTEFECSKLAKPVAAGSNVYFPVDKSGYTGVREYFVVNLQMTFDADDVTAHVPRYIPGSVFKMCGSTNEDIIFALSKNDPNAIYVYKFYWTGDEKAQSSWSRWTLSSDATILSMDMMNTKLYLVVQRSDGVYLECIDIQVGLKDTNMPILVHLDRKTSVTGTYNSSTNKTSWTIPYPVASTCQLILGSTFTGKLGAQVTVTATSSTTLEAIGDFSGAPCFVGVPYTMRYRFSPQFVKDSNKVSMAQAILKLRMMRLFYTNTGYFKMEVTPINRDTYTYLYTGKELGSGSLVLGTPQIDSGVFKFPVLSDGKDTVIDIVNDSYLPSFFQSAEWEGMFTMRSQRM